MKKFLAVLALPLMLAVAACDAPPPDGGVPPADPGVTTPAPETPAL